MKLHRDLGISQKSAWHLAHRIRQCWDDLHGEPFEGPVEADETYVGAEPRTCTPRSAASASTTAVDWTRQGMVGKQITYATLVAEPPEPRQLEQTLN